jgi:hypothetical protein
LAKNWPSISNLSRVFFTLIFDSVMRQVHFV